MKGLNAIQFLFLSVALFMAFVFLQNYRTQTRIMEAQLLFGGNNYAKVAAYGTPAAVRARIKELRGWNKS
jgi:hypothetical protein